MILTSPTDMHLAYGDSSHGQGWNSAIEKCREVVQALMLSGGKDFDDGVRIAKELIDADLRALLRE